MNGLFFYRCDILFKMSELLEREQKIRNEANELLDRVILPVLEKHGEIEVGGSYLYKLMYQRDIDILVISEYVDKESYVKLCVDLLSLNCVSKFKTTDRINFPHKHATDRPTGFWLSPTVRFNDHEWSLDIWMQKPDWVDGRNTRFYEDLKKLTEEQRDSVLILKKELKDSNLYGVSKKYESVDVYDAVLKGHSLSQLKNHFGLT